MRAAKKAGKTVDGVARTWNIPGEVQGLRGSGQHGAAGRAAQDDIQIVFDETR